MRIAELINTLEIGGAERMVVDLSRGLQERGHQVMVACLRESGALSAVLERTGIPIVALNKQSGFRPAVVRSLARVFAEAQIDVVHTHNPVVHHYGLLAARLAGVPVIINTLHGPNNLTGIGRTELIFELTCLFSDNVVACCQAVHAHLQRVTAIAKRRSTVILNGISLERFTSVAAPCPNGEFVFGIVGRLVPVKDHATLLRAFAMLQERVVNCRLEILGDGPMRGMLERTAVELGVAESVHFRGPSLDIPAFLSHIHTFILCSLSEGLPLTVLEAMAAARPIVGTSVGAIPELINSSGCGWISAPQRPDELAKAMINAVHSSNLPERGARGRQHVLENYSVASMVTGYEGLFERTLHDHRRNARFRRWPTKESVL